MEPIDHVSLDFEDNGSLHDDLVLRCGRREWRCDSYYFALDNALLPGQEDPPKVRVVLRRLMDQWAAAVAALPDGGVAFLPYDFSDQCTAWLRCRATGDTLTLQHGWAEVEGWSFLPSSVGLLLHDVPGFKADGESYTIGRQAFLRSIRAPAGS